jgi:hypothetical protein
MKTLLESGFQGRSFIKIPPPFSSFENGGGRRGLFILLHSQCERLAVDLVLFDVGTLDRRGVEQLGGQSLRGDVLTPGVEHLRELSLCLVAGGDAVFNVEASFLAHILHTANNLTR